VPGAQPYNVTCTPPTASGSLHYHPSYPVAPLNLALNLALTPPPCPGSDYYLVANDFESYLATQEKVDKLYQDQTAWTRMSIMSTAGSGKFSTDRTIADYNSEIWHADACPVPAKM
jgi:hypothetical protein